MTPEQLDEIEKLAEAATPGPWSIDMHADVVADTVLEPAIPDDIEAGGLWPKRVAGFPYTYEGSHQRKDAAFIVAMREHALPLVKALREAWAALDQVSSDDRMSEAQIIATIRHAQAQKDEAIRQRDEAQAEVEQLREIVKIAGDRLRACAHQMTEHAYQEMASAIFDLPASATIEQLRAEFPE